MSALSIFRPDSTRRPPRNHIHTVRDLIAWHWPRRRPSRSKVAVKERQRILGLFVDRLGDVLVDDLCGDDVLAFLENFPRVRAAWTVRRWISTIRHPFKLAEDLGVIRRSPLGRFRLPPGREGRDLTKAELGTLIRLANPVYRRILLFLALSGARPGELCALTWDKLRPDIRAFLLSDHKTADTQKRRKDRKIRLNLCLLKMVAWLRKRSRGPHVFTNCQGNRCKMRALDKYLAWLRTKAGLPEDVKLYGCRHYFGTQAILNKTDIMVLAELMGHGRITTTQRYVHLGGKDEYLIGEIEKATGFARK